MSIEPIGKWKKRISCGCVIIEVQYPSGESLMQRVKAESCGALHSLIDPVIARYNERYGPHMVVSTVIEGHGRKSACRGAKGANSDSPDLFRSP